MHHLYSHLQQLQITIISAATLRLESGNLETQTSKTKPHSFESTSLHLAVASVKVSSAARRAVSGELWGGWGIYASHHFTSLELELPRAGENRAARVRGESGERRAARGWASCARCFRVGGKEMQQVKEAQIHFVHFFFCIRFYQILNK